MNDILNFYRLTDRIASAGQPSVDQFSKIREAGYSVIVNLAMSDAMNAVPDEEKTIRSLGLTYVHIPVPFDAPNASHVKAFFGVMDAFRNEKVLVHCALNLRVSAFLYLYLTLRENIAPDKATTPFLTDWRPKMEKAWQDIINLTGRDLGQ